MWAAIFIAVSPAMVFYSRYFIHEMLLVFFTALTMGAGWRYVQARSRRVSLSPQRGEGRGEGWEGHETSGTPESHPHSHPSPSIPLPVEGRGKSEVGWALAAGTGLGLMFTTKETFVLTLAAMGLAGIITIWSIIPKGTRIQNLLAFWNWKHAALAISAASIIWLLLFSSFFTNSDGLLDSVRTYLPWLKRAGGHSPHIHPWNFYLERLAWFHPAKGPVWSEGLILVLAVVGAVVSFVGRKPLHLFLALYTIILTAIYSVISYKTPWCLLSFYVGMILLAGIGAAALVEFFRAPRVKVAMLAVLVGLTAQLAWQAGRASFVYSADRRNPYVYAQTTPGILELVQRTEGLARVSPKGYETVVKIIAPENDYWPLPWYLRRFKHLGWYEKIPDDAFAPIVIISSKLDARLDEKSDKKWLMVGLTELRPGKFFEQYVELELWKKYVETLPPERD